jgi:hypothetical protein
MIGEKRIGNYVKSNGRGLIWPEKTEGNHGNLSQESRCPDRNSNRRLPRISHKLYRLSQLALQNEENKERVRKTKTYN